MTEITATSECIDNSVAALRPFSCGDAGLAPDCDTRFRDLLGPEAWGALTEVVRRRFSKRMAVGAVRCFVGEVAETRLSLAGRVLGHLGRLVGGPLPFTDGATGPATVLVMEDHGLGGQIWSRTYSRRGHFPQTINSVKRFSGPTGLEEYLGFGLLMRLTLSVEDRALVFASAGYDVTIAGRRVSVPRWLSPGHCTITHRAEGTERFSFTLTLDHPRLGRLAYQVAHFEEVSQ